MVLAFVERTADNQHGAADGLPTTGHGSPDMQSGEVCRQLFEQYGCGSPWAMSESSEPAVFEIAAQPWWVLVFKRGPEQKPNSAAADWIRFYHGTAPLKLCQKASRSSMADIVVPWVCSASPRTSSATMRQSVEAVLL